VFTDRIFRIFVHGIIIALFAGILIWWILADQTIDFAENVPGMDNRPDLIPRPETVVIGEFFSSMAAFDEVAPGSWPRFRGSDFDNINKDPAPLADSWGSGGPPVLWHTSLGEGYAGAAVHNGRVYILDYNERTKADMLRCFSLQTGTELWRRWYFVDMKRNHGYSRTIPAVTDEYVVTLGPRSHVMCVDAVSGDLLWSVDLESEYSFTGVHRGGITPDFYAGQCPLIDNGVAVIAPGGTSLMIGIDCSTGKILWETPNPDQIRMSHCSVIPMTIHGRKMYVYHGVGGVSGVAADGPDTGKILWSTTEWGPAIVAASPLSLGENQMVVFGAYGAGGARITVNREGSGYSVRVTEQHKSAEGISSDQQTPILVGEHIWCLMPENSAELRRQLACFHKSDIMVPVWTSGRENRYGRGLGPYIVSGDKMYLLDDDANLYMFRLEGKSAVELARHHILDGIEAWGPLAIAGNRLIMRDARTLVCLDIGIQN
jgi:outer membrane protein assembly factor BamB